MCYRLALPLKMPVNADLLGWAVESLEGNEKTEWKHIQRARLGCPLALWQPNQTIRPVLMGALRLILEIDSCF